MKKAIIYGLKTGLSHWRTALIGYALQGLLALLLGLQVYAAVGAAIGNSLSLNQLLEGYDHTVISDLMSRHGGAISSLVSQFWYLLVLYLLVAVFIHAGLLHAVWTARPGWASFWEGGKKYFPRFLPVALFFTLLAGVWSAGTVLLYIGKMQSILEYFPSEKPVVWLLFVVTFVWGMGLAFLFNASVTGRLEMMETGAGVWKGIRAGLGWSFRRYFSLAGLFFVFLLFQLIFTAMYWWLESSSGMVSAWLVVVFFLVQQFFVFLRWLLRLAAYAAIGKWMEMQERR